MMTNLESGPRHEKESLGLVGMGLAAVKQSVQSAKLDIIIDIALVLATLGICNKEDNTMLHQTHNLAFGRDGAEYFVFKLGKEQKDSVKVFHAVVSPEFVDVQAHITGNWEQHLRTLAEQCRKGQTDGQEAEEEENSINDSGSEEGTA
ncbi:MAG: hypothetical protein KOO63_03060 [Bacteroidales bacterium]|nr:hypothetical protein [Candidatus Latescibacterota bacterium]